MMEENEYETSKKGSIVKNILLAAVLASIMIIVPMLLGLGKSGFEDTGILQQFNFYIETGVGFLIIILAIFFLEYIITRKDNIYGSSVCFNSPGEFPALKFFNKVTTFQMFLICLIIFSSLGLFNFLTRQQIFTGVGVLQQQFTKFDNLLFSSTLVTISENLGGALVIALGLLTLRYLGRRHGMTRESFLLLAYVFIPLAVGTFGAINHLFRGYQDVSLLVTFVFWMLGAFLTLLTGSFIVWWVLHIDNNLFGDLKLFFSSDPVKEIVIIAIIALLALYVWLYVLRKRKKKF